MIIKNIIVCIVLMLLSLEDIRYKSIYMYQLIILMVAAVLYRIFAGQFTFSGLIIEMFLWIILGVLSFVTGFIGLGDVMVLFTLTCVMGQTFAALVFILAVTIMSVLMTGRLVFAKIDMKKSIPFIPYIFISTMGVLLCG